MGRGSVYAFTDELEAWLGNPESRPDDLPQLVPSTAVGEIEPAPAKSFLPWLVAGLVVVAIAASAYSYRTVHFGAKAASHIQTRHIPTPEAQDFYLKGQFYWAKRTPKSLNQAVDSFTQAVVHDPAYAQAYVGLAESYNLLREFTLYWKWDWPAAEREFKRALALDPNNALAHHWYATALLAHYRGPEALAQIERAQKLDASSMAILADKGFILYYAGKQEAGIALLRQIEAAEPSFAAPHRYLAKIFEMDGKYAESLTERKKMDLLLHDQADLSVTTAAERGLASGGTRMMFENMRSAQEDIYSPGDLSPYLLAQTCARLGENRKALQHLRAAYERRDLYFLVYLKGDPAFDQLRSHPEFQDLTAKLDLPRPD